MELTSLHKKAYGTWAGQPRGVPADPSRCCVSVYPNERGPIPHQCNRKRGFGPEGAYCRQHEPSAEAARKGAQDAEYERKMTIKRVQWRGPVFLSVLRQIASGHNVTRVHLLKRL